MTQEEIQFLKETKRKNQICDAGRQYSDSMDEFQRYHTYPRDAFISGAMWSDEHPKENLVDIDRAARWVENLLVGNLADGVIDSIVRNFIEDMKK